MVDDFPRPATLPGGYRTGPPTDTTTYNNLNRVAAKLVERCVFEERKAGWQPTGQHDGIGVFVWSTNSKEDQIIENDQPRGTDVALVTSENSSAVTS